MRDELIKQFRASKEHRAVLECAALLSAVLEQRSPRTPQLIHDLALHYFSAGRGFERQAVDSCLAAASFAMQHQRREEAIDWLRWAEQAARAGAITIDPESRARFAELWNQSPPRNLPDAEQSHESADERSRKDLRATTSQC